MVQGLLEIVIKVVDQATAGLKKVEQAVNGVAQSTKEAEQAARRLKAQLLGFGLSALFSGMALSRATGGALKAIVNTSKIAGSELTTFNVKTNELTASWEFFKFTFIDALSHSELFLQLIDFVINLVNWFAELPEGAKTIILIGLAAAFLAGQLAMVVGQVGLFLLGVTALKGIGLMVFAALAVNIIVVLAALTALFLLWTSTKWTTLTKILATVAIALLVIGFIIGSVLLLAIGTVIAAFAFMSVKWGGVINFLKSALAGLIVVIAMVSDSIINFIIGAVNRAIDAINILISFYNRVASKLGLGGISMIGKIDFTSNLETAAMQAMSQSEFFKPVFQQGEDINANGGLFSIKDSVDKNGSGTNDRLDKIIDLLATNQSFTPSA